MKTKIVHVYWTDLVHMKNTIEVPIEMTKKEIEDDPYTAAIFDGAKAYSTEMKPDSLEIIHGFSREWGCNGDA